MLSQKQKSQIGLQIEYLGQTKPDKVEYNGRERIRRKKGRKMSLLADLSASNAIN